MSTKRKPDCYLHAFVCPGCGCEVVVRNRVRLRLYNAKYLLCVACLKVFNCREMRWRGEYRQAEEFTKK